MAHLLRGRLGGLIYTAPLTSGANIAVDGWQDFEFDTLNAANLAANDHATGGSWTVENTTGVLSMATAAEKHFTGEVNSTADTGTRGIRYQAGAVDQGGYITYSFPASHSEVSFGWWFRFPADYVGSFEFGQPDIMNVLNLANFLTEPYVKLFDSNQASIGLFTNADGLSSTINLSPNTWYWITHLYGATHRLRVYTDTGVQVGSEVTLPGAPEPATGFRFISLIGTHELITGAYDHDDLVWDFTNAAFPLGPPV